MIAGQPVVVLGRAHNPFSKEHASSTLAPATNFIEEINDANQTCNICR